MVESDTPRWRAASEVVRPRRCVLAVMVKVYGGLAPVSASRSGFAQLSPPEASPRCDDPVMASLSDADLSTRLSRDEEAEQLERLGTRMMQLRLVMAGLLDDAA